MSTLLAKRTNAPTATDDETYAALVADPEVSQFQQPGYNQSNQYSYIDSIQKNNRSDSVSQPTLTAPASSNAATGADVLVENTNKDWINKRWRPVMAWHYVIACTADFVIFPILWSILQSMQGGQVTSQWQPLTLQGAGLYHIAMGAVLGIAVYGRTKEKLEGKT
jgi:hypothetical protein